MASITSANAVLNLSVENLYPTAQRIQDWEADDAFASENVQRTERRYGIDGKFTAGFVFNAVPMTITILPNSVSLPVFENLSSAMQQAREVYTLTGTLLIPATGRRYTMTNGFLVDEPVFPTGQRTLQPLAFNIEWGKITVDEV